MEESFQPAGQPKPSFDELLAPLEQLADDRLDGPGRPDVLAVYNQDPEDLAWLVRKAERRVRSGYVSSPLGLLVEMARQGDHRQRPQQSARQSALSPVEKALRWYAEIGARMPPDEVDVVLVDNFKLGPDELAEVHAAIGRPPDEAAA